MRSWILCLLALTLAAPRLPASDEEPSPVIVELEEGAPIVGRIVQEECTDEFLVVRELGGRGAKRRIPWEDIKPAQASDLRVQLGFDIAEVAQGALKIKGHEIKNKAGTTFRGLVLNADTAAADGVYSLKTDEGTLQVRAADVLEGPTETVIDARQVYTPRELYDRKVKDKVPETAEDHYLLAEFSVTVNALDEAKIHYTRALELNDPRYTREKIQRSLDRIEGLLKNRVAQDQLKQVKRSIYYNNFAAAAEGIAAFRERYAGQDALLGEVEGLEKDLKEERDSYFLARVPGMVRDTVRDLLGKRVREEKEWTLREAMKYASGDAGSEDSVSRHALDQVAEKLGLKGEEVLEYWKGRAKRNAYKAFYRDGTFIVLDKLEDALAKAPKVKPPKGGDGKGGGTVKLPQPRKIMTPDAWWEGKVKTRRHTDLRDWLFAYWAEKSPMCEVLEAKDEICPTCAGKGYTQTAVSTPQGTIPFFDRCGTCHMATSSRIVRFK